MKIISKIASAIIIASLLMYYGAPVIAYVNEETIYSNLDLNGKSYKSTVTTIVEDSEEISTTQEENNKELPIETKITYYLDGKEIDSEKVAGKSGRITIKLEFENKDKYGDVYTPFVVVAGLMIDNNINKNIEIKNGKILTNGNTTIAAGIALPGMQESFDIDEDLLKLPSSIEISMDTEKFELGNIMIYANPKLFGEIDVSMEDFNEIFNQVDELKNASKVIENGAMQLSQGTVELDTGAIELSNGAKTLNDGVISLKTGVGTLADGVSTLNSQYGELDSGISNVKNGADALAAGSQQISDGAGALADGITVIDNGINGLTNGISEVDSGINQLMYGIESSVDLSTIEVQKNQLEEKINSFSENLSQIPSDEELENLLNMGALSQEQVQNYVQTRTLLEGLIESLQANYQSLVSTQTLYAGLSQIKNGIEKEDGLLVGANALKEGIEKEDGLLAGANSLKSGTDALTTGANELSMGTSSLKDGSSKVIYGLGQLNSGSITLKSGVNSLYDGSNNLYNGTVVLASGTSQIVSGSQTLTEGIQKFNSEGINKIVDLVNVDGKNMIKKLEKMEELSNEYDSFASNNKRDDLKFISITDSIKIEEKQDSKSNKSKTKK